MYVRLFLVYALLCRSSEGTSDVKRDINTIQATAGETVTLPCKISVNDDDLPTVEWLKEDSNQIAFLYRNGCETHGMKAPVFWYRTNFFMNELRNGNISLRLSNVQLSDAGRYTCMTPGKKNRKVNTLKLTVVAVSELKLSVVPAEGDGVTVQCESNCWFPKPEIVFLDDQEKVVSAEESKSSGPDTRGCFSVTRNFTMQTYTKRIICRVQQPEINQIRVTEIHIPPCTPGNCWKTCTVITVVTVILILCIQALIFAYKKWSNSECGTKLPLQSSAQSTKGSTAGGHQRCQADNIANDANEQHDKDETIRRLTEELNNLKSKQPIVLYQNQPTIDSVPSRPTPDMFKPTNPPSPQPPHNNPEPAAATNGNHQRSDNFPQNKDSKPGTSRPHPAKRDSKPRSSYSHSSPALFSIVAPPSPSSPSPVTSGDANVTRSNSFFLPRQHAPRSQRRHTTVLSTNRFSALENVSEDNEPLL